MSYDYPKSTVQPNPSKCTSAFRKLMVAAFAVFIVFVLLPSLGFKFNANMFVAIFFLLIAMQVFLGILDLRYGKPKSRLPIYETSLKEGI
ncbi:MAG: hypothetical protein QXZ38_03020 [Candidatus Micrarchaeaceae archaeon]